MGPQLNNGVLQMVSENIIFKAWDSLGIVVAGYSWEQKAVL